MQAGPSAVASASSSGGGRLSDALRDSERRLLVRARAMARGSSSEAARILGMGRAAFLRRLRQLGLDR